MNSKKKKSEITKAKIFNAAYDVFMEEGFENSNITKIAKRAGVAYGTVYTYFISKEDILAQILNEDILKKVDNIVYVKYNPKTLDVAKVIINKQITAFFEIAAYHKQMLKIMREAMGVTADIRELWRANIAAAEKRIAKDIKRNQAAGFAKKSLDPAIAAKLLMGFIDTLFWDIVMDAIDDIEQLADYVVELYMFGLYIPE
ncbi:MAG TPA: TetR/AcrR family transcriptional regulator [Syntrophomonas sp.]|nr:TetR/AcrR family transcriptional regulator [Syntrophomonas sp.]